MIIAPGRNGIAGFVTLGDDEKLPDNLNDSKIVVFRQGESTNRELRLIKPLGVLADPNIVQIAEPRCDYPRSGNPLHLHPDRTYWFYEAEWKFENGPFETYEEAWQALERYCIELQESKNKGII